MGRIGEVVCRTWQTADKMKLFRGRLAGEKVKHLPLAIILMYTCQVIIISTELMKYIILKYFCHIMVDISLKFT